MSEPIGAISEPDMERLKQKGQCHLNKELVRMVLEIDPTCRQIHVVETHGHIHSSPLQKWNFTGMEYYFTNYWHAWAFSMLVKAKKRTVIRPKYRGTRDG